MIAPFHYSIFAIRSLLEENTSPALWNSGGFESITTSSSESTVGSLFVPLVANRDGHDFILQALENGATGFLCQKDHGILTSLSHEYRKKAILVSDTLLALGSLANFHRKRYPLLVIGITGSSGKTTTKELIGALFADLKASQVVITEKNYNNEIGVPFTLFRITEKTKVAVCEMGMNHRGEIRRLSMIAEPNIAVITNIGSAHIENLESPENIAYEKSEITDGLRKGGVLFVPDSIAYRNIVEEVAKKNSSQIFFWTTKQNEFFQIIKEKKHGFDFKYRDKSFQWKVPGLALLSNALGAIALGEYLGISASSLAKTIGKYSSPEKRLTVISGFYSVIDDSYNANPESMMSSISASLQIAEKKPIVWILGTMKELGKYSEKYHRAVGEFLPKQKGFLISFGEEAEWIAKAYQSESKKSFRSSDEDIKDLIGFCKANFSKGTVFLVKGSRSMKMERIVDSLREIKD